MQAAIRDDHEALPVCEVDRQGGQQSLEKLLANLPGQGEQAADDRRARFDLERAGQIELKLGQQAIDCCSWRVQRHHVDRPACDLEREQVAAIVVKRDHQRAIRQMALDFCQRRQSRKVDQAVIGTVEV